MFCSLSVSWNIRNFMVSLSRNTRKAFFWENIRNFLILEHKKFFRGGFFYLSSLGWKVQGSIPLNMTRFIFFFRVSFSWNFLILEPESSISWNIRNFFQVAAYYTANVAIIKFGLVWEGKYVTIIWLYWCYRQIKIQTTFSKVSFRHETRFFKFFSLFFRTMQQHTERFF